MSISIHLATEANLPAINEIYNHYVAHSTATYQLEPSSSSERKHWFDQHLAGGYPVTVARNDQERVVGWGSLSAFHPRPAYRFTSEDSVYVHPDFQRQGIGRALLADLLERADKLGHRSIIALISADQEPSIRLHAAAGFVHAGLLRGVGFKFDRWLDVVYMQRGQGG